MCSSKHIMTCRRWSALTWSFFLGGFSEMRINYAVALRNLRFNMRTTASPVMCAELQLPQLCAWNCCTSSHVRGSLPQSCAWNYCFPSHVRGSLSLELGSSWGSGKSDSSKPVLQQINSVSNTCSEYKQFCESVFQELPLMNLVGISFEPANETINLSIKWSH